MLSKQEKHIPFAQMIHKQAIDSTFSYRVNIQDTLNNPFTRLYWFFKQLGSTIVNKRNGEEAF